MTPVKVLDFRNAHSCELSVCIPHVSLPVVFLCPPEDANAQHDNQTLRGKIKAVADTKPWSVEWQECPSADYRTHISQCGLILLVTTWGNRKWASKYIRIAPQQPSALYQKP